MIVKNEAQDLAQCLETVKGWVDEIVILDSGSQDKTAEIAAQFGAKFYTNTDWPGFGKQRQLAQQYVTSDYVLWLDADERVTETLKESILQAVKNTECFANVRTYVLSEDLHARGLTDMNTLPEVELHEVVTLTEYYSPQIAF